MLNHLHQGIGGSDSDFLAFLNDARELKGVLGNHWTGYRQIFRYANAALLYGLPMRRADDGGIRLISFVPSLKVFARNWILNQGQGGVVLGFICFAEVGR